MRTWCAYLQQQEQQQHVAALKRCCSFLQQHVQRQGLQAHIAQQSEAQKGRWVGRQVGGAGELTNGVVSFKPALLDMPGQAIYHGETCAQHTKHTIV